MDKELLMLYGARHAVLQMLKEGNCFFSKQMIDGTYETVGFIDICNYLFDKIEACKEQER